MTGPPLIVIYITRSGRPQENLVRYQFGRKLVVTAVTLGNQFVT